MLVFVQEVVDTATTTDPQVSMVLALAGLAAFLAQWLGGWITNKLNGLGDWLESKHDGFKQVFMVALTAGLGLFWSWLIGLFTNSNSYVASFLLALIGGVIAVVNTGTAIKIAKAKVMGIKTG